MSYVESGSIAAKAGLRFGDQIVQINGESVAGNIRNYFSTLSFLLPSLLSLWIFLFHHSIFDV